MDIKRKVKTFSRVAPIAVANGDTLLRQNLHIKTGARLSRPNMIYVMINNACNLSCRYCDIWKNKGEGDLPTETWIRAFDELLSWTKHPKLNISGGEPFIRKDIFDILNFTVKKGAVVGVVTNGWAMTPKMVPRVVDLGLSNLNISIDSLEPEVCDFMRGKKGHTKRTILSIQRVMEEIRRQGVPMKVYLKCIVAGPNSESLVPLVRFAEEHGIHGIMFQPLEAIFSRHEDFGDDWYKNTPLWPENPQKIAEAAAQLIELKKGGAPISNPISHLESFGKYFENPIGGVGGQVGQASDNKRIPCRVGHTHLYINANGSFKLCWMFDKIGNIQTDFIREKWKSDFAEKQRAEIEKCQAPCLKTCLLDRGLKETVSTFFRLVL